MRYAIEFTRICAGLIDECCIALRCFGVVVEAITDFSFPEFGVGIDRRVDRVGRHFVKEFLSVSIFFCLKKFNAAVIGHHLIRFLHAFILVLDFVERSQCLFIVAGAHVDIEQKFVDLVVSFAVGIFVEIILQSRDGFMKWIVG